MKLFYTLLFAAVSCNLFSNGVTDSLLTQEWNSTNSKWENYAFTKFFIAPNCSRIDSIWYCEFNPSQNLWVVSGKSLIEYNTQNRKNVATNFSFDGSVFKPSSRTIYTYQGGELSDSTIQYWEVSKFEDASRFTFYRSNGKIDSTHYDYWEKNSSKWLPNFRAYFSYASALGFDEIVVVNQNFNGNSWVNSRKEIISKINATGNTEEEVNQKWDFSKSTWVFLDRKTLSYDAQNRVTEILYENYDENNNQWVSNSRQKLSYSGSNITNVAENYNSATSTWEKQIKSSYNIVCILPSSVEEITKVDIQIKPNPTVGFVEISSSASIQSITVFDAFGKIQNVNTLKGELSKLNLNDLAAGIYFLHVETSQGKAVSRILKN